MKWWILAVLMLASPADAMRVEVALPPTGGRGFIYLYGTRQDGSPYRGQMVGSFDPDSVVLLLPDEQVADWGGMIACNEWPEMDRVCGDRWPDGGWQYLPEPAAVGLVLGALLTVMLRAPWRRRH